MRRIALVAMIASVAAGLLGLAAASAQETTPPPFPILYQGVVYVDGVPLEEGVAELTVRVGDWESRPAMLRSGGRVLSLLATPPDLSYIGKTITFHLSAYGGLEASQRFIFPALGEPRFETVRLDFSTTLGGPQDGTPEPLATPTATLTPTATPTPTSVPTDASGDQGDGFPWLAVGGGLAGGVAVLALVALRPWRLRRASR